MVQRAAIYVRVSYDRRGEAIGVADQESRCRDYAARKGWAVAEVLSDNDLSAYKRNVRRPGYERLLTGLADGTYDGLIIDHVDRFYRTLRELVRILDIHSERSFALGTVLGEIDLSTDSGRTMARILGSVAEGEIERKTTRQKNANKARALEGKPQTRMRAFGWESDNMTLKTVEADAIRQGYADLISGSQSLGEISRAWTLAGLRTDAKTNSAGNLASAVWTPAKVRGIFERPRNCGRSVYQGKPVGTGQWEPIVSEEDHDLLQSIFATRSISRDNRRVHAISGLPVCGKCGLGLFWNLINGRPYYTCKRNRGHLGISAPILERAVTDWLTGELANSRPETIATLNLADTMSRIRTVREALAALGIEESELGSSGLPLNTIKAYGATLTAKRAEPEAELTGLLTGDRVTELLAGLTPLPMMGKASHLYARHDEILERWNKLSVPDQHLVLSSVCTIHVAPGRGDRVKINSQGRKEKDLP